MATIKLSPVALSFNVLHRTKMRRIFVDVEHTSSRVAYPLEIAVLDEGGSTLLDTLIRPPPEAFKSGETLAMWNRTAKRVHGIRPHDVRNAPSLKSLLLRLRKIFDGAHVIGHHVAADLRVLPPELIGISSSACSMKRFRYSFPEQAFNLAEAMQFAGLKFEQTHRALSDAKACRQLWIWMDGQGIDELPPRPPALTPKPKPPRKDEITLRQRLALEEVGAALLRGGAVFLPPGTKWADGEVDRLLERARAETSIAQLAASFGRHPVKVARKLVCGGLAIEEAGANVAKS